MVFTLVENLSYVTDVPKFIDIECNDPRSMQAFIAELEDINIDDKLEHAIDSDPQKNYDCFIALLNGAKNKHLPKKRVRFNKNKHKKSKWMTNGILKSIKEKDKLYKKLVKANIDDEIAYANLKAEFTNYKKIHLYYTRTFALYKNDIKQTWSVIKDTLQRKRQCKPTEKFSLNNRIITDLDDIANAFNAYFVSIGRSLSDQIHSEASSQDYLLEHNKPNVNFNLIPVNETYIENIINKLKNISSCGYDNFSNKHIKYARNVLTKPLTLLINQCLQTGIYPSQLKMSRIKPLFKSGDKDIDKVNTFSFLGILVDSDLCWKSHINMIRLKISRLIGILHRVKRFFPKTILITIYKYLIMPHLNYGLLLWGAHLSRLVTLQKRQSV